MDTQQLHSWVFVLLLVLQGGVLSRAADRSYACAGGGEGFPFCDRALPLDARVANLVSLLTLNEKTLLLPSITFAIPRLGIPGYVWLNEGLHGVADNIGSGVSFDGPTFFSATSFPQPILTAASFNVTLFNKIGQVISTEARAFHNEGQSELTFWAPNINIFRDPRWGRGQETPGEDPLLTSLYAEYLVRGFQQDGDYDGDFGSPGPAELKVSACCKHLTGYDMDFWDGADRHSFNALISQRDLAETFNPPFEACVRKGRASGMMCSYNAVNGVPTCADPNLIQNLARGQWGFDGYFVSDCSAITDMVSGHGYVEDFAHATALALRAGMDVWCEKANVTDSATRAVEQNLASEADIDGAVSRSLKVLFRLGVFDGHPKGQPFGGLGPGDVCSDTHRSLAVEAAAQGTVLLKNVNNTLPLSRGSIRRLAVIGPNANDEIKTMLGNYAGPPCEYVTPLQGLRNHVSDVQFVKGCPDTACETVDTEAAVSAAATADATILVLGLSLVQEREAFDRVSLLLPSGQTELVRSVCASTRGPVVLVIMSGGPVDITFAKGDERIGAILWIGYPGQGGGTALSQIIFGDANPGGKLPITWYPESFTSWAMTTMDMRPDPASGYPGRTYRFYTGPTVYNFGHGLSYSNFSRSLSAIHVKGSRKSVPLASPTERQLRCYVDPSGCDANDVRVCGALDFEVEVAVSNSHSRAGADVVMLYAGSPPASEVPGAERAHRLMKLGSLPSQRPREQRLVAFRRVHIGGNESRVIRFMMQPCEHFTTMRSDATREIVEGVHILSVNREDEMRVTFSAVQKS